MADYDIGAAFGEIEDELISSMIRNLKRHQVEEVTEGIEWAQWQALQLQALEDYKRQAVKKFGSEFSSINDRVEEMLTDTYNTAETTQEQKILKAIQKGLPETSAPLTGSGAIQGEFFKTNDRKLDTLIKATTNDMERAEHAVLRMTDDKYRKIIFNAQVYANTGAGTYEKAVDMATKDFLSAGINCIEYKNGRRVPIDVYAEMAIRTANKRAYLQAEGEMRKKWGIHTVIMNKRSNPCPKCAPFVGKIIVDDVWSGGAAEEAKEKGYLLMSECIKDGLYHPNCQDSHTTYFGDIDDEEDEEEEPEEQEQTEEEPAETEFEEDEVGQGEGTEEVEEITEPITPEEQRRNIELYNAEQRQNYCERQVQRFERMSKYSLDKDNQRIYRARGNEWKSKVKEIKSKTEELRSKSIHRISELNDNLPIEPNKTQNPVAKISKSDIISYSYSKDVKKDVREAFDNEYKAMTDKFGKVSTISSVETLTGNSPSVFGEFGDNSGILSIRYANKKDCLKQLAQKAVEMKKAGKWSSSHPMHVLRHEIGHAIQMEFAKNDPLWKEKKAKIYSIMKSVDEAAVSSYAMDDIDEFISECIAESMTKKARKTSKNVVNIILGG